MLRGAYSRSAASGGKSEAVARQRPAFQGLKGLKRGCRNKGRVAGARQFFHFSGYEVYE